MVVDGSFVPLGRRSVASVEVDGERVLLDVATGSLHVLDPVASLVWPFLDGSTSVDELAGDLSAVFGAGPDRVRDDLLGLVRDLAGRGLLADAGPVDLTGAATMAAEQPPQSDEDEGLPRIVERPGST